MTVTVVVPPRLPPASREHELPAPGGTDAEGAERAEGAGTRAFCRDESFNSWALFNEGQISARDGCPRSRERAEGTVAASCGRGDTRLWARTRGSKISDTKINND